MGLTVSYRVIGKEFSADGYEFWEDSWFSV